MAPFIQILVSLTTALFLGLTPSSVYAGAPTKRLSTQAMPMAQEPIAIRGEAKPLAAWSTFCTQLPNECTIDLAQPRSIVLTEALWRTIADVNLSVNRRIRALSDPEHWGVVDRWDYPDDGIGDCEDIQLQKRRELVAAGLPRRAMRMTVVIDDIGEGHAVLIVRTDHGDLVLDNKSNLIAAWQDTGYVMIKMESQYVTGWVKLGPEPAPVATANP